MPSATANNPRILVHILHGLKGQESPELISYLRTAVGTTIYDWSMQAFNSGEYLISSSVVGHAMKDTAYIVARAAEPVDWDEATATIDDVKHRKISVFFESFVRNHAQERTEARLRAVDAKLNQLTAALGRQGNTRTHVGVGINNREQEK